MYRLAQRQCKNTFSVLSFTHPSIHFPPLIQLTFAEDLERLRAGGEVHLGHVKLCLFQSMYKAKANLL